MKAEDIDMAGAAALAPVLLACLQRLGQLGRSGALALAQIVEDGDFDFDEAAEWIAEIAAGKLND